MKESFSQTIKDILFSYQIREDFQVDKIEQGETFHFLQLLSNYLTKKLRENLPVDGECVLRLLLEFITIRDNQVIDEEFLTRLIHLFRYTQMKNKSICKLFDILRVSIRLTQQQQKVINCNVPDANIPEIQIPLPLDYHPAILETLAKILVHDDPPHIHFPGDKDSFLQVSSIPWAFSKGYTLTMWVKLPTHVPSKGFELFRCRSPTMKMDGTVLGQLEEGEYAIKIVMHCEKRGRDEARGKIVLTAGNWHLLSITHAVIEGTDKIMMMVDNHLEMENELAFPLVPATQETHWTFGIGFAGKISSITLYEQELSVNAIQLIYSLGPSVSELNQGVSIPQTSYDTGHLPLGTLSSKGKNWNKWCRINTSFCVTAVAVASNYALPQTKIGKQYPDYIVMIPLTYERETPLLASMTGRCELMLNPSFTQSMLESGGCLLPIYLFWCYSANKFDESVTNPAQLVALGNSLAAVSCKDDFSSTQINNTSYLLLNHNHYCRESMIKCLELIKLLLLQHIDLKEQFLQIHGFHLLSFSLSSLSYDSKRFLIDKIFVDCCFELIESLGPDCNRGDGIATALQGFLFEFRIWNACNLPLLKYYLERLVKLCSVSFINEHLYKNIGIQKLLDIYRIHISKIIASSSSSSSTSSAAVAALPTTSTTETDSNLININPSEEVVNFQLAKDCADEFYRLLVIVKDISQQQAQKLKSNIIPEIDILLMCLIETNNSLLAERILRLFINIRISSPSSLQQSLINNRFYDIFIVNLWSKKLFSIEIRTQAIINLFWLLTLEIKPLPSQLCLLRKKLKAFILIPSFGGNNNNSNANTSSNNPAMMVLNSANNNSRTKLPPIDANKMKMILEQIKMFSKPLPKHWMNLLRLNDVFVKALIEGAWGTVTPSCLIPIDQQLQNYQQQQQQQSQSSTSSSLIPNNINALDLHTMLHSIIGEIQDDLWLLLPFITALLSRIPLELSEKLLLQFNLGFKTDEYQCEIISNLDERIWLNIFLQISFIGIFQNHLHDNNNPNNLLNPCNETYINMIWGQLPTFTDLALDTISILIDYKMKNCSLEGFFSWHHVKELISDLCEFYFHGSSNPRQLPGSTTATTVTGGGIAGTGGNNAQRNYLNTNLFGVFLDRRLFKRLTLLLFQKLIKNTPDDAWSLPLLDCIESILTILEENIMQVKAMNAYVTKQMTNNSLLEFEDDNNNNSFAQTWNEAMSLPYLLKNEEDFLLLQLILDILETIRKINKKFILNGREYLIIKKGFLILINSLHIVEESFYLRISQELFQNIAKLCEMNATLHFNIQKREFTKLIYDLFFALEDIINNPLTSTVIKSRFSDIIFSIVSFFSDLRVKFQERNYVGMGNHLEDLFKKFIIIETMTDIDLLFNVLRTTIMNENSKDLGIISFEESHEESSSLSSTMNSMPSATQVPTPPVSSSSFYLSTKSTKPPVAPSSSASSAVDANLLDPSSALASSKIAMNFDLLDDALLEDSINNAVPGNSSVDLLTPEISQHGNTSDSGIVTNNPANINTSSSTALTTINKQDKLYLHETNYPEDEKPTQLKNFLQWLKVRQGIVTDRIDSERTRLTKAVKQQDILLEATRKFWKKAKRKTESEYFLETHKCQWKLGISHEGLFFGRKRLVLRPRFEFPIIDPNAIKGGSNGEGSLSHHDDSDFNNSSDDFSKLLASKDLVGYIKDVTRSDQEGENKDKDNNIAEKGPGSSSVGASEHGSSSAGDGGNDILPGTGWGIVDADGEDGFGVIGIAKEGANNNNNIDITDSSIKLPPGSTANVNNSEENLADREAGNSKDLTTGGNNNSAGIAGNNQDKGKDEIADLISAEEALNSLKGGIIETGPSHSGTARYDNNSVKLETKVVMVTASGNCWGYLQLTDDEIFFRSSFELEGARKEDNAAVNIGREQKMRRRKWRIDSISSIYTRRYRLRDSAIEIFFRKGKHRNVFFDFGHTKENAKTRNEFSKLINAAAPPAAFKQTPSMLPHRMVYEHGIQDKWLNGKISNFDYLMALNTMAGRSFNDLCQYPVFPWVISDYDSDRLDLNNPNIYRDLSKPMGALNENRLKEFLDRFNSFEENVSSGIPAFMYGSHYSTMVGVVLHFLVRMQPYAALHKEMQNGHFDVPDRLFSSIPRSYHHNTTQLSEVKEITPEWFTTPDMFRNINNFDFGLTQDGEVISDVELPKWAKTAEEFVKIHREALESDYVSEHLHEWIDLIFGYKQRGHDSIEACNVFYYLTYYGAVDLYAITDETLRKATELQIAHFGQVPLQLFNTPHPARKVTGKEANLPITRFLKKSFALSSSLTSSTTANDLYHFTTPISDEEELVYTAPSTLVYRKSQSVIVHVAVLNDRILCVLDNGVIEMIKYCTSDEAKATLSIAAQLSKANNSNLSSGGGGGDGSNHAKSSGNTSTGGSTMSKKFNRPDDSLLIPMDQSDFMMNSNSNNANNNASNSNSKIDAMDLLGLTDRNSLVQENNNNSNANNNNNNNNNNKEDDYYGQQQQHEKISLKDGDLLIAVEKEIIHFETVPRIPIIKYSRNDRTEKFDKDYFEKLFKAKPAIISCESNSEYLARSILGNRTNKLLFSIGHLDGSITLREIDLKSGFIKSCADYHAHRRKVISISCDSAADYQIIASLDESGLIFVWTVVSPNANNPNRVVHAISRRPQRLFRCDPSPDMHVEISWQMGIVIVISGLMIKIFSIERNELLRTFPLKFMLETPPSASSLPMTSPSTTNIPHSHRHDGIASSAPFMTSCYANNEMIPDLLYEYTCNGPIENIFGNKKYDTLENDDLLAPKYITRRFVISDYGMIIIHLEAFIYVDSLLEYEDQLQMQHLLVAYTISGIRTAVLTPFSPITCLTCPDRGEVVIAGHRDGSIVFYQVQDLTILHKLQPSNYCTPYNLVLAGNQMNENGNNNGSNSNNNTPSRRKGDSSSDANNKMKAKFERGTDTTAIISISVGPNRLAPTVICVTTEAGNLYLKALPDFIKWEKQRSPSALAQFAAVPLQAVKGTLIQAQNWTAETAGVFAQNAKNLADEALSELKKLKRNSLVKGAMSLFGMGKNNNNGNEK